MMNGCTSDSTYWTADSNRAEDDDHDKEDPVDDGDEEQSPGDGCIQFILHRILQQVRFLVIARFHCDLFNELDPPIHQLCEAQC